MNQNKPKVFSDKSMNKEVQDYLKEHTEFSIWDQPQRMPREQFWREIADADAFITGGTRIDRELLSHAKKLRMISTISVGYNHFDLEAMKERNIIGTHTPYVLDDSVADVILGLMLSTARRIPELDAIVKRGDWKRGSAESYFGVEMHHKTLGIIGMGRIGEAVAKRAKFGFDMDVLYYNRNPKPETEAKFGVQYRSMVELLQQSDFVVLMTPLTDETVKLIGANEFKLMKKSAIFVNASRGQIVDEQAMIDALNNGEILAAGLDVFEQEPIDASNPLTQMSNVVTLPHIGSATHETRDAMAMVAAQTVVSLLTENKPLYVVKELEDLI